MGPRERQAAGSGVGTGADCKSPASSRQQRDRAHAADRAATQDFKRRAHLPPHVAACQPPAWRPRTEGAGSKARTLTCPATGPPQEGQAGLWPSTPSLPLEAPRAASSCAARAAGVGPPCTTTTRALARRVSPACDSGQQAQAGARTPLQCPRALWHPLHSHQRAPGPLQCLPEHMRQRDGPANRAPGPGGPQLGSS